jgi:hypothetical protein
MNVQLTPPSLRKKKSINNKDNCPFSLRGMMLSRGKKNRTKSRPPARKMQYQETKNQNKSSRTNKFSSIKIKA